jgi:hypothetical protein
VINVAPDLTNLQIRRGTVENHRAVIVPKMGTKPWPEFAPRPSNATGAGCVDSEGGEVCRHWHDRGGTLKERIMASAPMHEGEYGQLRVSFDDEVRYFALAPEATLADIGGIFATTSLADPHRLRSVQVTILTDRCLELDSISSIPR